MLSCEAKECHKNKKATRCPTFLAKIHVCKIGRDSEHMHGTYVKLHQACANYPGRPHLRPVKLSNSARITCSKYANNNNSIFKISLCSVSQIKSIELLPVLPAVEFLDPVLIGKNTFARP